MRLLSVIVALWALAGCQLGPVAPLMSPLADGAGFGYREHQLSEHRYEVVYLGPRARTWLDRGKREEDVEQARGLVYDLALWRAAEIAVENDFAAFTVEDRRTDVEVEIIDEWPYYPYYDFPYHHRFGYRGSYDYGYGFRSAWLRARGTLTVALRAEATDASFDAAATVRRLEKKHPDALEPRRY